MGMYMRERSKNKPFMLILSVLVAFLFGSMIYFAVVKQVRNLLMSLCSALLVIPFFLIGEYILKIEIVPIIEVLLTFLIAGGVILGPCFDFYFKYPWWDDMLHGLSGSIFFFFGVAFMRKVSKMSYEENIVPYLIGGFFFCIGILFLWEMFEYMGTELLHLDMQEDKIINSFHSFYLAGSHNFVIDIDNITQTIIYYGDGRSITIDGYLDIGLYDTLDDMLIGMIGSLISMFALILSKAFHWNADKYLVPHVIIPTSCGTMMVEHSSE